MYTVQGMGQKGKKERKKKKKEERGRREEKELPLGEGEKGSKRKM